MSSITIELDEKRAATLKAWADEAGMKPEELVRELIDVEVDSRESMLDLTPEQRAAIEAGLEDIRRGDVVPHEVVMAKARKIVGG